EFGGGRGDGDCGDRRRRQPGGGSGQALRGTGGARQRRGRDRRPGGRRGVGGPWGGPTSEKSVVAPTAGGKPVFCEKPLATTPEACERVLAAETAFGRRLVQVGFMRRYDAAYVALREGGREV